MSKGFKHRLLILLFIFSWLLQLALPVYAAPYFYITGTHSGEFASTSSWLVKLNTDTTLTATQTVINFDSSLFGAIQINNLNSKCSFWAPPEPSLGFGKWTTPYFMDFNKVVLSCGFSSPGYVTTNGEGDFILSFALRPWFVGTTEFTFSDSEHRYIGTTITPGTDLSFEYESIATVEATVVIGASVSAAPTPTPLPPDTLAVDDLKMVDYTKSLSRRMGSAAYGLLSSGLGLVPMDNTIPPPPTDLPLRPKATPYPEATRSANQNDGQVLSIQSLRELLIPGKSDADKRLVAFNLIALLTFIFLLAALIWRLVTSARVNKVKYRHMKELLEGEISVIQSKLAGVQSGSGTNEDVIQSLEELRSELEKQK